MLIDRPSLGKVCTSSAQLATCRLDCRIYCSVVSSQSPGQQNSALRGDVLLPGEAGDAENSDLEVSDEDLEFVQQHSQRLGFLEKLDKSALDK